MSMTQERKKAQDKLRRKYGYSTNDNFGRGTILYKADDDVRHDEKGQDYVFDVNFIMDNRLSDEKPIQIMTRGYLDKGEGLPDKERYEERMQYRIELTLEELDLIHEIAHKMAEENNWDEQIRLQKSYRRRRNAK